MLILNHWIDHPNWFLILFWAKFNFCEFWQNFTVNWKCRISHLIFRMNFYKSIHDGNWEIPPFSPFEPRECETSCEILAVRLIVSGFTDGRWRHRWTADGLKWSGISQRSVNVDKNYPGRNYHSRAKKSKYFIRLL